MARRGSQSLVLEVAATTTKLDAGVKAARSVLAGFKGDVGQLEAEVKRAFADLGGDGIAQSARRAETEFNRMFRSVASNAKAIMSEGDTNFAVKLFDVGAADEQVRSMQMQALELRRVGQAATEASRDGSEFAEIQRQMATAAFANAEQLEQQALELDKTAMAFRGIQTQMGAAGRVTGAATEATAQHRAGLQQLGYQLGDVATMYSLGMRPAQIFGSQIGQITQAVQMMSGGTSKFAAFLGGPWGIALTVGVIALAPLVSKLWEGEEAAEAAEMGANGLATAQSALGQVFDLVSGKLKSQNELLMINARLTAINLRAEAIAKRAGARETLVDGQKASAPGFFEAQTIGIQGLGKRPGERNADAVSALLRDVGAGKLTREQALVRSQGMDFSGTQTTRAEFQAALRDTVVANLNDRAADLIDQSLDSGSLAPELRNPGRDKRDPKPKADNSAREALQRARALEDAMTQADESILGALLKRAETEDQRLNIQLMQLAIDSKARDRALDRQVADKELTEAQAAELKAKWAAVDQLEEDALQAAARQTKLDELYELERVEAEGQMEFLRLQAQLARTLDDRRLVAQQILELELEERRRAAEKLLDSKDPVEKQRGSEMLANLPADRAAGQAAIDRDFADPVEQYLERLRYAAENTSETLDRVRADGLQSLEDGLVNVITGTESVASAFKKMANQIIADLVRIAVQKLILNAVSGGVFSFLGLAEGGEVQELASGGFVSGPGSPTSDSIPAMLSNGEFVINAAATARFKPLLQAINEGRVPGFAGGGSVSLARLPAMSSLRPGAGPTQVHQHFHVDAKGSILAAELVNEMKRIGATAAIGGSQMAQQELAEQGMATIE